MSEASSKPTRATSAASGPWTAKRVQLLKELWLLDDWNSAKIAERLGGGINRGAVIGKAHRLGLRPKPKTSVARQRQAVINTGNGGTKSRAPLISPDFVMPQSQPTDVARKRLRELNDDECRWPVGHPDERGFGFCAAEKIPNSSYCHEHFHRSRPSVDGIKPKIPANDREKVEA